MNDTGAFLPNIHLSLHEPFNVQLTRSCPSLTVVFVVVVPVAVPPGETKAAADARRNSSWMLRSLYIVSSEAKGERLRTGG